MRLKDQIAIVTGAASGFGRCIAEHYAAAGSKVVVADLNGAGAEAGGEKHSRQRDQSRHR